MVFVIFIIADASQPEINPVASLEAGGNATTLLFCQDYKTEFRCVGDWAMLLVWVGLHLICCLFSRRLFGIESLWPGRGIQARYSEWDAAWERQLELLRTVFSAEGEGAADGLCLCDLTS
eukprot:COSAG05_NODE_4240_length_1608_cov_2584.713718_2_plen_120_part_00